MNPNDYKSIIIPITDAEMERVSYENLIEGLKMQCKIHEIPFHKARLSVNRLQHKRTTEYIFSYWKLEP